MDLRMRFVSRLLQGERMTDLCHEFEISRKTGYKILKRYERIGIAGLEDLSRARQSMPNKTNGAIEEMILALRSQHPTWGPKKIKARLETLHPGVRFPAQSTIGEILDRAGLVQKRKRNFKRVYHPSELTQGMSPNHVWCIDFKGQFRLGDRSYCYPLTITDQFSRSLLGCEALTSTRSFEARGVCEEIFEEYGLPEVIRSDNGIPFSSSALDGLSTLSAWWLWLGIRPERIEPGCPEQNGTHERFHLTLKQETTRPARRNLFQQQELFDRFKEIYNEQRPHESLGQKTPDSFYKKSSRKLSQNKPPSYELYDEVCRVDSSGKIRTWNNKKCFLTRSIAGYTVGLRRLESDHWIVNFANHDLGLINPAGDKLLTDHQKV